MFLIAFSTHALAAGEDILAHTGEYTFFIQPEPGSCETYYQKMVPCIAKETIMVPKKVTLSFTVPVPSKQGLPVLRTETPVGCATGSGPCVDCYPKPSCRPALKEIPVPKPRIVRIPTIELVPKCVERRVMLPQWFKVKDEPRPPKKIRKVPSRG